MLRKSTLVVLLFAVVSLAFAAAPAFTASPVATNSLGLPVYRVAVGDIQMGYAVTGKGSPLVLLTGLACTVEHWPPEVVETLSRAFTVILLDNRGMGYSTDTGEPFSYELLSEDVVGFLRAIGIEKADFLGYSMGSIFIQYLLLHYPQLVDRAVLHATALDSAGILHSLEQFANAPLPTSGPVKRQLDIVDDWHASASDFQSVENQVLLIVGTADPIVDPEDSSLLAQILPGSWLVRFPGNTHYLMFENPVDFADVLFGFLTHGR
ncbi:MAG TPA: alpha/beta fold hydrolase [Thermotogota bacterium]|nr:alpha/beta fold hydrolase [Thermotogota bacterium]